MGKHSYKYLRFVAGKNVNFSPGFVGLHTSQYLEKTIIIPFIVFKVGTHNALDNSHFCFSVDRDPWTGRGRRIRLPETSAKNCLYEK
ncbi:MAG: hypothetical protein ACI8P9_002008 [Parasphingorhabdus sp.]|jgi:hypothetical protein